MLRLSLYIEPGLPEHACSSNDIALCRHQERGDNLFIENARLGQDLETQKLNLADINEFLTSELEASGKKLRQIEEKADALQQQVDNIKETHKVRTSYCKIYCTLVVLVATMFSVHMPLAYYQAEHYKR